MRMNRRGFLKAIGAGACLAASGAVRAADAGRRDKPNIVLVMADDQGWGDMAYYGHPVLKTPNFDDMAAKGLRFDRFYAACPVCTPTRGSVMTGRHPNRFGCFKWGHSLRPQEITIAEALKTAGYTTGHFRKWHLGSVYKNSPVNPGASGFDEWLSAANFYDNGAVLSHNGKAVQTKGESSMVAVDAAIEFMRKSVKASSNRSKKPFLAVVWFGSPHDPHQAIEADRKLYEDQPKKMQNFLGEITGMDRAFGKLRKELGELGIRDNTILWYCSDNGGLPGKGVTGGRKAKGSIYEGGLRVPGIIEWPPHVPTPRKTAVPCNTIDIYPTLLDIVGVKMTNQPPLDGVSLVDVIEGKMTKRPQPMGFWDYPARGIGQHSTRMLTALMKLQAEGKEATDPALLRPDAGKITKQYPEDAFPGHSAWLDWPWKLHRIEKNKDTVKIELYNLVKDPQEAGDQAAAQADRVKTMRAALEAWLKSVVRSLNGKDYT